ncbi:diacylglycerol kinase family protein [Candidatus Parcubacteria bacterium]|nr:MAG: diacylglycerol kinase family protein [Candidatus Parcubacteria bacterium]
MINSDKLVKSFGYAFEGIRFAFKNNQNLKINFLMSTVVIGASFFFQVNTFEKGILGVMILLLACTEMINTAIEEMVNFVTREHALEAKIAKDVAAGMVLLVLIGYLIVVGLVFKPYIIKFLNLN